MGARPCGTTGDSTRTPTIPIAFHQLKGPERFLAISETDQLVTSYINPKFFSGCSSRGKNAHLVLMESRGKHLGK